MEIEQIKPGLVKINGEVIPYKEGTIRKLSDGVRLMLDGREFVDDDLILVLPNG